VIVYAVIGDGGKQYRVAAGDIVELEYRPGTVGEKLSLAPVLAIQDEGVILEKEPLSSAKVLAEVVGQGRARKVVVFKKKRRKAYRRTQGHRQAFTRVKILEIQK
jgi:large subunit ribosomal protein L21